MYGYIASETFAEDIQNAINQRALIEKVGTFDAENFINHINSALRITLTTLIVDITCTNEEAILKGLKLYKIQRSDVRIILFAPDKKPGDLLISNLVSIGVWDIIAPELPELNDEEEFEFDVSPLIEKYLLNPATYGDAVRWHTTYTEQIENINAPVEKHKEKVIFKKQVEKQLKTEVVVEKQYITIPHNTVAVINLSKRAGSTFFVLNMAKLLAENNISVSILENPLYSPGKVYLYDILGMESLEEKEIEFYSVPHIIHSNERFNNNKVIVDENIEYFILDPRKEKIQTWTFEQTLRYLHSTKNTMKIIDIGSLYIEEPNFETIVKLIEDVDQIVVMVEPLPHEMLSNLELYEFLNKQSNEYNNVTFVMNKWNDGVDTKFTKKTIITNENSAKLPYIEIKHIYDAFYNNKIPIENSYVYDVLIEPMAKIIERINPEINIKTKNNKKNNLLKLLKLK